MLGLPASVTCFFVLALHTALPWLRFPHFCSIAGCKLDASKSGSPHLPAFVHGFFVTMNLHNRRRSLYCLIHYTYRKILVLLARSAYCSHVSRIR